MKLDSEIEKSKENNDQLNILFQRKNEAIRDKQNYDNIRLKSEFDHDCRIKEINIKSKILMQKIWQI